jgi:hypothetical protein
MDEQILKSKVELKKKIKLQKYNLKKVYLNFLFFILIFTLYHSPPI